MQKNNIPKGMRDFTPEIMLKRNYIFDTIKEVYSLYGYKQIETPSMENLSTLMGKYGEEGDKLIFKILNSGDIISKVKAELNNSDLQNIQLVNKISEKGLRYDLTVPLARYVVTHRDEISFPFKRFQIQPVWRADRPQRGRYREFYQCDADVIGSSSLINEVELINIINDVFCRLGIKVKILINNRKILTGIAEYLDITDKFIDIITSIDKIDKIGLNGVNNELRSKGFSEETLHKLQIILNIEGSNRDKLNTLKDLFKNIEIGLNGINEVSFIMDTIDYLGGINNYLCFDISLARGLSYYTGSILEVKSTEVSIGSLSGGGRYDNLTEIFGLNGISGVGISFGADRIYDTLEELDLFPKRITNTSSVLFINFGEKEQAYILPIVKQLRLNGIKSEIYPDCAKIKKQMSYANNNNIPFVAMVGNDEIRNNIIKIKNMISGEQTDILENKIIDFIKDKVREIC